MLVVFLRGVNVGGHRTFRPSELARRLRTFDVANIGAAGTFVARNPGRSRVQFRNALLRALPFATEVMVCSGSEILRLESENPFGREQLGSDVVRFVSILSKAGAVRTPLPVSFPAQGDWLVRLLASRGRFVFGAYRRNMKTISYLGKIDALFGAPATTRNWNTIVAATKILKGSRS